MLQPLRLSNLLARTPIRQLAMSGRSINPTYWVLTLASDSGLRLWPHPGTRPDTRLGTRLDTRLGTRLGSSLGLSLNLNINLSLALVSYRGLSL